MCDNTWLSKTFPREWIIVASGYLPTTFPILTIPRSAPLPPSARVARLSTWGTVWRQKVQLSWVFASLLRRLLQAKIQSRSQVDEHQRTFCNFEIRRKGGAVSYRSRTTSQDDEKIINFCTRFEYIDEHECSPFHLYEA